ncbi:MAG: VOC family protein [Chloroflexi bacterium]|nr:VOC family protein [Chloroflexota bacterium]
MPKTGHTQKVIPAVRITDYERSKAFYVDGLGFTVEGEHRFAPHLPVFATLSRDGMSLYLTQHAGDCQVGALVFLFVDDVDAFYEEITERGIKAQSPPEDFEGRLRDFRVIDPDGNKLDIATRLNERETT